MLEQLFPNVDWEMMWEATYETIYMTVISTLYHFYFWITLGIIVIFNKSKSTLGKSNVNAFITGICQYFSFHSIYHFNYFSNSIYKVLVGTIRGTNAALPALIIGAAPFYARMVLIGLREIDKGVIEAAKSMGAKTSTIIFKVLIPESTPALISGITVTAIALLAIQRWLELLEQVGLGNLAYL